MEDNNKIRGFDGELSEEQKGFGSAYLPNDPHFQEQQEDNSNKEVYFEAVEVECRNCSIKDIQEYDTPITKLQYLEDCINKICPQCREPYQLNPIEVGFEQKATKHIYTLEEWQRLLIERYQTLKDTVFENMPHLWNSLELILSIKPILHIKDITLPLIIILLGAPSSTKTVGLTSLRDSPMTFYTDNFTRASFVSHNTGMKEEQLKKIDMLPMIKNKLVLAPEMAPLFAKKDEDLKEVLSIITRIADGQGYMSNSGGCGHRGYDEPIMFLWLGAAVEIPPYVYQHLARIGAKIYFYRLPRQMKTDEDYLEQLLNDSFETKLEKIKVALNAYLNMFEMGLLVLDKDSELKKIEWDKSKDDIEALKIIIKLGKLLAHLRAYVPTWDTTHSQGLNYAYGTAQIEEPDRAIEQLKNIARGHALSLGRNYITMDDLSIPIKVVLSTASIERVKVFDLLLAHKGELTTSKITMSLNMTAPPARRTMFELQAVEIAELIETSNPTEEKTILLKDEFKWFLSEEFDKLREKFRPEDYKEYLEKRKKSLKEKPTPRIEDEIDNEEYLKEKPTPRIDST